MEDKEDMVGEDMVGEGMEGKVDMVEEGMVGEGMEDKGDMEEGDMENLLTIAMVDKEEEQEEMDVLKAAALLVLPLYAVAVYATC